MQGLYKKNPLIAYIEKLRAGRGHCDVGYSILGFRVLSIFEKVAHGLPMPVIISQKSFLVSRVTLSWSTCGRIHRSLRSAERSHAGLAGRECGLIKLFPPTVSPKGKININAFQLASTETLN